MNKVTRKFVGWLYKLLDMAIAGGATALMAMPLFSMGEKAGLNVLPLNFQDMGLIALAGAIGRVLPELARSGLPQIKELEDTEPPFKPEPTDQTKL